MPVRCLNLAHRGASSRAPENTHAAFHEALRLGADGIELDLRTTADRQVVVMHDEHVDRTTNGSGPLRSFTLEQVRRLDAGSWFDAAFRGETIPTLHEVFDRYAGRTQLVLHVKEHGAGIEDAVDQHATRLDVRDSIVISSRFATVLRRVRQLEARLATTWLVYVRDWPLWLNHVIHKGCRLGAQRLAPPGAAITARMVEKAHANGLKVRAWGVESSEPLASRLLRLGVDGMTFNDPERLAGLIAEYVEMKEE